MDKATIVGLFLKGLILALGAATGVLAIMVTIAFGALVGKGLRKLGSLAKRKPKPVVDGPVQPC